VGDRPALDYERASLMAARDQLCLERKNTTVPETIPDMTTPSHCGLLHELRPTDRWYTDQIGSHAFVIVYVNYQLPGMHVNRRKVVLKSCFQPSLMILTIE
jgi:hypothetical protein